MSREALKELKACLQETQEELRILRQATVVNKYAKDPKGYAKDVLGVTWTPTQAEIAESLLHPPYKTLVKAAHVVGKSKLAGDLTNWWYDTFNPSIVLTTAPTDRQVRDILWKEIRVARGSRGGFRGPKMPRLEDTPNHWAHGFTARDGDAFQGRHDARMLIIFDEAVGVDTVFWDTAKTMFDPSGQHAWLCIFNPTDTASQAYQEDLSGNWTTITMSALDHPNLEADRRGESRPIPGAVTLAQVDEWVRDWCSPIDRSERSSTDIEWPVDSGQWVRPGPLAESRMLGRWPSAGTYGVWSDAVWMLAAHTILPEPEVGLPEIGCDPARHGDDFTSIHVRKGPVSIHHESANGWDTSQTAGRLKQLVRNLADKYRADIRYIPVKVDPDGLGWGVIDQRGDYNFIPVSASATAMNQRDYPNRRTELWFAAAKLAKAGRMSFAKLPKEIIHKLRGQAMSPIWKVNGEGQCELEKKEDTKERLGRSPDDMDALNLAYWPVPRPEVLMIEQTKRDMNPAAHKTAAKRRGLYGTG